jgi:hypothetical protein
VASDVVGFLFCPDVAGDDPIRTGLAAWLADRQAELHSVDREPSEETAFASAFKALTERERAEWLRVNLTRLHTCLDVGIPESNA